MALLRRGDLSVIEVCFADGCSLLGTFSSRFTELVGVPPTRRDWVCRVGVPTKGHGSWPLYRTSS
jgi:hypothetical protein